MLRCTASFVIAAYGKHEIFQLEISVYPFSRAISRTFFRFLLLFGGRQKPGVEIIEFAPAEFRGDVVITPNGLISEITMMAS